MSNRTKEQEYKRMISRVKAITTYFNNQLVITDNPKDRLFCSIATDNMDQALTALKDAHNFIYEGTKK